MGLPIVQVFFFYIRGSLTRLLIVVVRPVKNCLLISSLNCTWFCCDSASANTRHSLFSFYNGERRGYIFCTWGGMLFVPALNFHTNSPLWFATPWLTSSASFCVLLMPSNWLSLWLGLRPAPQDKRVILRLKLKLSDMLQRYHFRSQSNGSSFTTVPARLRLCAPSATLDSSMTRISHPKTGSSSQCPLVLHPLSRVPTRSLRLEPSLLSALLSLLFLLSLLVLLPLTLVRQLSRNSLALHTSKMCIPDASGDKDYLMNLMFLFLFMLPRLLTFLQSWSLVGRVASLHRVFFTCCLIPTSRLALTIGSRSWVILFRTATVMVGRSPLRGLPLRISR